MTPSRTTTTPLWLQLRHPPHPLLVELMEWMFKPTPTNATETLALQLQQLPPQPLTSLILQALYSQNNSGAQDGSIPQLANSQLQPPPLIPTSTNHYSLTTSANPRSTTTTTSLLQPILSQLQLPATPLVTR